MEEPSLEVFEENWKYCSLYFLGFAHHLNISGILCLAKGYKFNVVRIPVLTLSPLCSLPGFSMPVTMYGCHACFFFLTAGLSNAV